MQALLDAIHRVEMPAPAQRVFHGRGGLYLGSEQWVLDHFSPVWVLTSYQANTEEDVQTIGAALEQCQQPLAPDTPFY
jgi:23S rRNA (cytosine1962-C5)-methyltransferase